MPNLKIPPEQAVGLLRKKVEEIEEIRRKQPKMEYYDVLSWCSTTWRLIDDIYPGDEMHPEDIRVIGAPGCSCGSSCEAHNLLFET
ncbi:MAG TPA: hypothetical protein PLO06_04465, partial [Methanoregulaceae archaeon]|nr:hypothetical protein [Methanoregulaceae archaeon]HPD76710.1 hypothetical protein [Methanoregulaceae archaeon]